MDTMCIMPVTFTLLAPHYGYYVIQHLTEKPQFYVCLISNLHIDENGEAYPMFA